jgi:hypothetical protein
MTIEKLDKKHTAVTVIVDGKRQTKVMPMPLHNFYRAFIEWDSGRKTIEAAFKDLDAAQRQFLMRKS